LSKPQFAVLGKIPQMQHSVGLLRNQKKVSVMISKWNWNSFWHPKWM